MMLRATGSSRCRPAGSSFTKSLYDSQARVYASYQGYYTGAGSETYSEAGQITSSNKVFEQCADHLRTPGAMRLRLIRISASIAPPATAS